MQFDGVFVGEMMRQSVSVLLGESVFDVLSSFCCCSVLFSFRLIVLLAFYPIATNPFYFSLSHSILFIIDRSKTLK